MRALPLETGVSVDLEHSRHFDVRTKAGHLSTAKLPSDFYLHLVRPGSFVGRLYQTVDLNNGASGLGN